MSYLYLQEQEVESSEQSSSGGGQSATSSGTSTASKSSVKESKTGASMKPLSSETLTTSSSQVQAKKYQGFVDVVTAGFPCQPFSVAGNKKGQDDERNKWPQTLQCIRDVRPRYAFLENVPGLLNSGYFGEILSSLAQAGFDAKMGVCSEQTMWEHRTDAKGSGYWPTPTARDWKDNGKSPAELARNSVTLATHAGGQLNPTWVEWLMGWPLGWTDLKPLGTDKYQQWLQQHGKS